MSTSTDTRHTLWHDCAAAASSHHPQRSSTQQQLCERMMSCHTSQDIQQLCSSCVTYLYQSHMNAHTYIGRHTQPWRSAAVDYTAHCCCCETPNTTTHQRPVTLPKKGPNNSHSHSEASTVQLPEKPGQARKQPGSGKKPGPAQQQYWK